MTPYERVSAAGGDRWLRESLLRQMFADTLRRDEVQVELCKVWLLHPGSEGRPVSAWVALTDRGLLARVGVGAGIQQTLRVDYCQVKLVDTAGRDPMALQVSYFNADRAVDEVWRLHLESRTAAAGFGAALTDAVASYGARASLAEAAETVAAAEQPGPPDVNRHRMVAPARRRAAEDRHERGAETSLT